MTARTEHSKRMVGDSRSPRIVLDAPALNETRPRHLHGGANSEILVRLLVNSMRAMGLHFEDVLNIARQLTEHSGQVNLLFSSTDGADETGYLEFLERCLVEA